MKRKHIRFCKGFRVVVNSRRSQAASMVLAPGAVEGGPDNKHRGADQWLYVDSGTGEAVINSKSYPLVEGTLILIEAGDRHEIRNLGTGLLKTLNLYVPPAYEADGTELPRGRKSK
jgi:mannose-6-phosphate isomerase-like protein (cupin superfamily)